MGLCASRCGTAHYQMVSQFQDGKGIWPEHVRAWEEWQKKNPKLAQKKITIGKKTTISGPVRNLFNS